MQCGRGQLVYEIPTESFDEFDRVELRFEASAKMQLKKDANGAVEQQEGADFMAGYRMDPGENHNSYFMTDEKLFPSALTVLAEEKRYSSSSYRTIRRTATACSLALPDARPLSGRGGQLWVSDDRAHRRRSTEKGQERASSVWS